MLLVEPFDKNIDKTRDLVAVVHGIGPDGCNAVGSIVLKVKSLVTDLPVHCGAPYIELWHGLPTIHCAISKHKKPLKSA